MKEKQCDVCGEFTETRPINGHDVCYDCAHDYVDDFFGGDYGNDD